jgi:murein DD-endopeptidase MepM/ murein hydrolase activator NlpD
MENPLARTMVAVILVFIGAVIIFVKFGTSPQESNTLSNAVLNAATNQTGNPEPRFENATNNATQTSNTIPTPGAETLNNPTSEFKERITKKFFGTYVSPSDSPVQPEKFTGYHTGVDVEFTDTTSDIPVYALADGKIVLSKTATGYGGIFVVQFTFISQTYTAIYGHIRPSTLPSVGTTVTKGQQLAILGTGGTNETDGERHHLHFGIHSGTNLDIKGYVQNKSDLSAWIDPLSFY